MGHSSLLCVLPFDVNLLRRYAFSDQQSEVSFLGVCPVIDYEFRHNIVKVAVDRSADFFDNVMTKFIVNNMTDA